MTPVAAPTVREVLDAVEAAITGGDITRAKRWLRGVREAAPLHHRVFYLGALLHLVANRDDRAIDYLRRSLMLRPANAIAATQIGVLVKARAELATALTAQLWATTIDPANPDLLYNLAGINSEISRPDKALEVLSRALELAPGDPDLHRSRATMCLRLAEPELAIRPARKSILLAPGAATAYLAASTAAWATEKRDSARSLLRWAFRIAPLNPEILFNMVRQALEVGAPGLAVAASRRAVIASPDELGPVADFSGATLEARGVVSATWRWGVCLAGRALKIADDLTVGRTVGLEDLLDPKRSTAAIATFPDGGTLSRSQARDCFIIDVRDAVILPRSQTIVTAEGDLLHEGLSPLSVAPGIGEAAEIFYWKPKGAALVRIPRHEMTIKRGMLLGSGGGGNHYHWLIDFVPRLFTLMQHGVVAGEPGAPPLLVSDDCPAAIVELLGYLGVEEENLIFAPRGRAVAVDHLSIPAMPSFSPAVLARSIQWVKSRLAGPAAGWLRGGRSGEKRVYLDRRSATSRRVMNEGAVVELLAKSGFDIVSPDPTSMRQQITKLMSARIIVSAHGAGMANMIFAPPGCEIIELTYPNDPPHIAALARACGHHHEKVICTTVPSRETRPGRWDMAVPLEELAVRLASLPV